MLEGANEAVAYEEESTSKFRLKLEEFSFHSPQTSPSRRSPRLKSEMAAGQEASLVVSENSLAPSRKRTIVSLEVESPTKTKKKRGYAPPETYAHLDYLTDCLGEYLDVLFCGINPGVLSATVGHHFAHPGNRFYKMLHGSGFTDRLIRPEEDNTLPASYNIGITDIVDRPSSCEDELSTKEMIESVPNFLQKVTKYKPRFVCFIGKGMGQKVEKGFKRIITESESADIVPIDGPSLVQSPTSPKRQKRGKIPTKRNSKSLGRILDNGIGLRPFKITQTDTASLVRETLFFVSHSSSGLATSMTLQGKVDLLKELRELVVKHKAATLDTSSLEEIPV